MSLSQPWIAKTIICMTLARQMFMAVKSYPEADKVARLPGQPQVGFQQFSGYISVDDKQERALFYYFVEAEKDPHLKPLVLWLTGGPGCSSVGAGGFTEHGPFLPTSGQTLIKNSYSWNKEANMLYLESPAGVGFSYSADKSFYEGVNDTITAKDSLVFLQRWFEKFPEYKNRDFFISGESYGGHYVPQLARLILDTNTKFNLKGISIGNGLLEYETDYNSVQDFYWSHGLISDSTYHLFNSVCNNSQYIRQLVLYPNSPASPGCLRLHEQLSREKTNFIDQYDVTGNYCLSTINGGQYLLKKTFNRAKSFQDPTSSSGSELEGLDNRRNAGKYEDCIDKKAYKYLNRKDVQKALHARLVGSREWRICETTGILRYDDRNREIPTIGIVGSLVKAGIRAVAYSGDQDSVIPFIGTRILINKLAKELGLKTTVPYSAWFESNQVGGWTQVYGNILSFSTVRGASHVAPTSQPARSYLLFKSFLSGKPLPAYP